MNANVDARASALEDSCVNIGPRQRQKRVVIGVVGLLSGCALYAALLFSKADPLWFSTLFVPFALAGFGIFQALDKT